MQALTKENWNEWLANPVTVAMRHHLESQVAELKESWALGLFLHEGNFATAISQARAIGNCDMAKAILELDFSQLEGSENDD